MPLINTCSKGNALQTKWTLENQSSLDVAMTIDYSPNFCDNRRQRMKGEASHTATLPVRADY